jgi:glycerol-3-phosphate dehydrogenase subunit C
LGRLEKRIAYHIPCHLRALGIGYPAVKIFEQIEGLECFVLDDNCCGLAGTYGFKKRNQDIAHKLGVIASIPIRALNVDAVVADCGACRMQLGHYTGLSALDPVEIIAEAMANSIDNKKISGHGIKRLFLDHYFIVPCNFHAAWAITSRTHP